MATSTSNLGLTLPSVNDAADIAVLNSNFQKIDGKIPSVGAAPATIVQKELRAASEAELDTALTAEVNTMSGNSVRFLVVSPSSSALFGGVAVLCELYLRSNSGYATATFTGYGTTSPIIYHKTMWAGAWKPLVNGTPNAFAPSGYGLGTYAQLLTADHNLNNPLPTGLYRWGSSVPVNAPSPIGYAVMLHIARTDGDSIQKVWHLGTHSGVQISCERYLSDNKGEWEWTNPPMQLGVEYRTTERYQGKAVYTMLVHCGAGAVAGGYKTVSTPIAGTANTVRYHVDISNTAGNKLGNPPLDYADGSVLGRITVSASNDITMMCYKDLSATDTYCQLWYTKD